MFQKTLEQLRDLQALFNEKFALEKELAELPKEVDTQEKMVQQLKKKFVEKNEKYGVFKNETFLKRHDLQRVQKQRERLEKEIGQVNSQRDYERIDRAIKENEEHEYNLARDLSIAEGNFEEFKVEFENSENFLRNQEEELEKTRLNVQKKTMEAKMKFRELKKKEQLIASNLEENLVFKFERIIRTKGGGGVVPIRKNICYGCSMLLPLQFVNSVRLETEVLTCPYCSKIVFYDGSVDSEEVQSNENSGLQDIVSESDIELDDFSVEDYEEFFGGDDIGSDSFIPSPNIEENSEQLEEEEEEDEEEEEENEFEDEEEEI